MIQVNPSFNIQAQGVNFEQAQLFVEAGPMGISFVVLDSNNIFKAVVTYNIGAGLLAHDLDETIAGIFKNDQLLQNKFGKTHIFWSFPESILVPVELMNTDRNTNMLNLVFGDAKKGIIRSDFLFKHNLHNVYRTPAQIIDIFATYLPVATQTHLFSTLVNKDIPEGNHLFTVFYHNSISIVLCKEGKLQVVQNFEYNSPEDCVFHLLNVCKSFDVLPDSVQLHIGGMIEAKSGLFDAIFKYFLHIEFEKLPPGFEYDEAVKAQPDHFFSHLFYLASCV